MVDLLKVIAIDKEATPAQIALAWLLGQKSWIVPIPGTTKIHRLQENISASYIRLSAADMEQIEQATSKITIQGARYPEALQNRVGK
ncbi:putative oxidoreductase YdbC [compost metagenome]